jgi:hypothetical protein
MCLGAEEESMSGRGHTIASANQRDRDYLNKPRAWGENREHVSPAIGCGWPKCRKPEVVFVCSYRYVTGRKGRIGVCEKFYCEQHGRKFAAKHNLAVPDPNAAGTEKSEIDQRTDFVSAALGAWFK